MPRLVSLNRINLKIINKGKKNIFYLQFNRTSIANNYAKSYSIQYKNPV